jgi:hypothetical protein
VDPDLHFPAMTAMTFAASASGRLMAQSVMASTHQLVRALRDGHTPVAMRRLMGQRRQLLAGLARDVNTPEEVGSLTALRAAVAESDRTLEALLG